MEEITYEELFKEFCEWSPEHAKMVKDYRPWGRMSFVVWFEFKGAHAYKVKRYAPGKFIMQPLSKEDINKKLGI